MKVIDKIEKTKKKLPYPVLTLGNFDGVHLGHQAIFKKLIDRAKKMNGTTVVYTFVPHPLRVIAPERAPRLLTTYKDKITLIEKSGIDAIICANFTKKFATISAESFVRDILHNLIGVKEIIIGANYNFGKGRKGSPDLLKEIGRELGFKVTVLDEVQKNDVTLSSSRIRALVAKGKVDEAAAMLGRCYSSEGIVIEGANRGKRLLNTPTANLLTASELLPKDGVYAVTVEINGKMYGGASNIGHNPTFKEKQFSFETHVLDFDGELVGKTIRVHFVKRVRDEMKFSSASELSRQLKIDIEEIRNILKKQSDQTARHQ